MDSNLSHRAEEALDEWMSDVLRHMAERRITQFELSALLGGSPKQLRKWLRREHKISAAVVLGIVNILGIDPPRIPHLYEPSKRARLRTHGLPWDSDDAPSELPVHLKAKLAK